MDNELKRAIVQGYIGASSDIIVTRPYSDNPSVYVEPLKLSKQYTRKTFKSEFELYSFRVYYDLKIGDHTETDWQEIYREHLTTPTISSVVSATQWGIESDYGEDHSVEYRSDTVLMMKPHQYLKQTEPIIANNFRIHACFKRRE